jgi:radical SAM-linked protein
MIDRGERTTGQQGGWTPGAADALLVVRFGVGGLLRFLSHAETFRVFQRACVRADLPIKYSQGFNPHPRLSLPLPRTVGVESEDELLAVRLYDENGLWGEFDPAGENPLSEIRDRLTARLPADLEVREVTVMKAGASIRPQSAQYVLPLTPEAAALKGDAVRERAASFLAVETVVMERTGADTRSGPGAFRPRGRQVNVRPFVKNIEFEQDNVIVTHSVGNAGSVRVEEILQVLNVTGGDLAGPIRRRNVTWRIENQ